MAQRRLPNIPSFDLFVPHGQVQCLKAPEEKQRHAAQICVLCLQNDSNMIKTDLKLLCIQIGAKNRMGEQKNWCH